MRQRVKPGTSKPPQQRSHRKAKSTLVTRIAVASESPRPCSASSTAGCSTLAENAVSMERSAGWVRAGSMVFLFLAANVWFLYGYRVIVPYVRGFGPTRFLASDTPRNGQQAVVAVDATGRVYSIDHTGDWYLGPHIDHALALADHLVLQLGPARIGDLICFEVAYDELGRAGPAALANCGGRNRPNRCGRNARPTVSTTTQRQGREWCGAGAEHAADSLTAALNLAVLHFDRGELAEQLRTRSGVAKQTG